MSRIKNPQLFAWFQEAEELGNVTLACRRLGISRNTFYKWRQRWRRMTPRPVAFVTTSVLAVLAYVLRGAS
jgi:transposase-like protein